MTVGIAKHKFEFTVTFDDEPAQVDAPEVSGVLFPFTYKDSVLPFQVNVSIYQVPDASV